MPETLLLTSCMAMASLDTSCVARGCLQMAIDMVGDATGHLSAAQRSAMAQALGGHQLGRAPALDQPRAHREGNQGVLPVVNDQPGAVEAGRRRQNTDAVQRLAQPVLHPML